MADESGLFEMEPMNELRVGHDVHLKSILKSTDAENEVSVWYAQVGGLEIIIFARINTPLPPLPKWIDTKWICM